MSFTRHQHAINTPSTRHQRVINTPLPRHQHVINTSSETKLDDVDIENVRSEFVNLGYSTFIKNRFSISSRRSGGILVAMKSYLYENCKEIKTDNKACLWFLLKKKILMLIKTYYVVPYIYHPRDQGIAILECMMILKMI